MYNCPGKKKKKVAMGNILGTQKRNFRKKEKTLITVEKELESGFVWERGKATFLIIEQQI